MTLGTMFARNNVLESYANKDPFWDPYNGTPQYSLLNQVEVPTTSAIRSYQIEKIEEFENKAFETKFQNLDSLAKDNFNNVISSFENDESQVINQMLENFVTKMNSFYYVNKGENKSERDWKYLRRNLAALEKALKLLMKELSVPKTNAFGMPTVLQSTLEQIQSTLAACGVNSLDVSKVNEFLKNVNQIKGDTLEELGVAYFRQLGIPNIESIRLGSVFLNTDGRQGRHKGQLIQDLIAFDITSPDIVADVEVEYKPIGSNNYIKAPLSKLFEDIEKANGGSKQISITDETYDVLMNLQSINIQAKSGKNQLPWNQNASTSVSIGEYDKVDKLAISVYHTFSLLHSLNSVENSIQPWMVKDTGDDYNALANYGLATVMSKVLHLSEQGNQFVLTPFGFMTFSARMKQLLKTNNYIALIQGNVAINKTTMSNKYKVGITKQ